MALPTRFLHCTKNLLFFVVTIMTSIPKIGFHFINLFNKVHYPSITMIFAAKYLRMH